MSDRKDRLLVELEGDWRAFLEELGVEFDGPRDVGLCPFHDDTSSSFSVYEGEDGRRRWKCHAGCGGGDLLDAFMRRKGLAFREALQQLCDRFHIEKEPKVAQTSHGGHPARNGRATAEYVYHAADGRPVFRVSRYDSAEGKTFVQARYDQTTEQFVTGKGCMRGVRRPPYRLPDWRDRPFVALVEGEKCAEALIRIGIPATTTAGGAEAWRDTYAPAFTAKKVLILPDNDDPGRKYAFAAARDLHAVADQVRVLELPGLAEREDVADWIERGGTRQQLQELARAIEPWQPPQDDPPTATAPATAQQIEEEAHLTDMGNAQRLVEAHGTDILYCHPWNRWLEWDGRVWVKDKSGGVLRRAKQVVRGFWQEAAEAENTDRRASLFKHAIASEKDPRIQAMVRLAACDCPVLPDELDGQAWLLNCPNGVLDLKTGRLGPHRRDRLMTKLTGAPYDPNAECPRFEAFLQDIFEGHADLIEFVQKALGYSLTADTREQVIFIHWGDGENGKSTLLEAVAAAFGQYSLGCPPETLLAKKSGEGVPNDVARLKGARFVTCAETGQGRWLNVERVKALTGQDRVSARFMRAEWFDFIPTHKIHLATNHRPKIADHTHSIWRRIRLIPYLWRVTPETKDPDLGKRLRDELPGILRWAVDGCLEWHVEGLEPPAEVRAATDEYRAEQDPLADFVDECCVLIPDAWTSSAALWEAFREWAKKAGEKSVSTRKEFNARLTARGLVSQRSTLFGNTTRGYRGIGICAETTE